MKLVWLLLIAAAAVAAGADLKRIVSSQENESDGVELASSDVLVRHARSRHGLPAKDYLSFATQRFVDKHVANRAQMTFLRGRDPVGKLEEFASKKAREGYSRTDMPIDKALPGTYTIIVTDRNDRQRLAAEFQNRNKSAKSFITDNKFTVFTFTKNGARSYVWNPPVGHRELHLGVANGEVNHFAGAVECRNNGRQSRRRNNWGRRWSKRSPSVFRHNGRLCTQVWTNPSTPESESSPTDRDSGVRQGIGQGSPTQSPRVCPRGYRRVAGRCVRQRQRQRG